jgi:hypothetical protein
VSEDKWHNKFAFNSQKHKGMEEGFIESDCTQLALMLGKKDY